jgi:hypothetical protein
VTDVSFVRREARPQVEVYCDESGLERFAAPSGPHDRALFGGIWLEARHRRELKAAIRAHREQHRVASEFRWNKVSPSRLEFYLGLVDLFFESSAHFRAIVLPVGQLETGRHHGGDAELMFYKFYYQLLHHWIFPGVRYRIFVDQKTDRVRSRVRELRDILQSANGSSGIDGVQSVSSDEVDILQLADVLTGAVGFKFQPGRSTAKHAIIQRIERHIGRPIGPTSRDATKFNIFCWRPGLW